MSNLPKPPLQAAIEELKHRDEFKVIVQFVRDERERFFGDFRQAETANDAMKIAGSIAALDELVQVLAPPA